MKSWSQFRLGSGTNSDVLVCPEHLTEDEPKRSSLKAVDGIIVVCFPPKLLERGKPVYSPGEAEPTLGEVNIAGLISRRNWHR